MSDSKAGEAIATPAAYIPPREGFADVAALEEFMTRPTPALVDDLARIEGDIMVIGVGGKMGPTLAGLAKRAAPKTQVTGVARFSEHGVRDKLSAWGVETIACDLLDRKALERLPATSNIIFMAGRKFGSTGAEHLTWAMNGLVPAMVAEKFAASRIVAFSTGCVYPFVDVAGGGASESTPAKPPPGDYAYSCLARERMFEHFSRKFGTPGRLIRLNYAIDMRYGVLHDVARRVRAGEAIDLTTGHVNVIWQGDANTQALRALAHCTSPTSPLNVTGPETVSIRALAMAFGERFGQVPVLHGREASTAWLSNSSAATRLFGRPNVTLEQMIDWVAAWIAAGGVSLDKDTHYATRDGEF